MKSPYIAKPKTIATIKILNIMKIKFFIPILLIVLSFACIKSKTDQENPIIPNENVKTFELLNGSYTGNIYKWKRDYDSTHINVVETFDTIYNATSILEINEDSNQVKFGGILYKYHDDLIADKDTIKGLIQYNTLPYNSIEIIKSKKFVRLFTNAYAPIGPWAYSQTDEYYKD